MTREVTNVKEAARIVLCMSEFRQLKLGEANVLPDGSKSTGTIVEQRDLPDSERFTDQRAEHTPVGGTASHSIGRTDTTELIESELFPPPTIARSIFRRSVVVVFGVVLMVIGVALGPVPVIPGFPFVIAGALMLATSSQTARSGLNRVERWLPVSTRRGLRRLLRRPVSTSPISDRSETRATR